MTVPAETKVVVDLHQLHLLQSRLAWTQHYLSSTLSSTPLIRVSLRPLSFVFSLVSPFAAAVDGRIDQLARIWLPSKSNDTLPPVHADDTAARAQQYVDLLSGLSPASLPFASLREQPVPSEEAVSERTLVGAAWERHMKDELALSDITPDQCLHAFYNANCHCFLALSSASPTTASSVSPPHSSRSALTFVSRLRSALRSAWHPDLLPAALSFHQLASRHLQHHSLLFPPPSPFPFFLSDSFRDHYFALHALSIRAVYEQQLSAVCPAVLNSLERMYSSAAPSASLRALQEYLAASPSLSALIPHISHALNRIHHQQMTDSLADTEQSTALVLSTPSTAAHFTLTAAMWSTVDVALARWRQAVQRGCWAVHECVRVMEEESARRDMREHDNCLELDHDEVLLIADDDSDDEDKQLVPLPPAALSSVPSSSPASSSSSDFSLSQRLQRHILTSLKQLTANPFFSSSNPATSQSSAASSPSSPALHYHLSHLYSCLASLHNHLLHYLLSSSLLSYPSDLLFMARESALCVLGSEKERVVELEYGGLVGKLCEVMRAFSETVVAVQTAL